MEFIVPQFIEKETQIAGPFTFKQFIYFGIAGFAAIFLYFIFPFYLFILCAIILLGGSFALAFFKRGGMPLPTVIKNAFIFLSRPKIYLWRRKMVPPKIFKEVEKPKEEIAEESILKVSERSSLRELSTRLETKTK